MIRHVSPTPRLKKRSGPSTLMVWVGVFVWLCVLACSASDEGFDDGAFNANTAQSGVAYDSQEIREGLSALRGHQPVQSRIAFEQALVSPSAAIKSTGHAGRAITSLMLIGDDPVVRNFLGTTLALDKQDYSMERLVWADEGMLYWFAQGVRWSDDGTSLQGVKSIMSKELPFSQARLEGLIQLSAPMTKPMNEWLGEASQLMPVIEAIEKDIEVAVNTKEFEFFYLPGDIVHDPDLNVVLRKSEFHMLRAALSGIRALYYIAAAYQYDDLTLESVAKQLDADSDGSAEAELLNTYLLRKLLKPLLLVRAQGALDQSLSSLIQGIEAGLSEGENLDAPIQWSQLGDGERTTLQGLVVTLKELKQALAQQATLTQLVQAATGEANNLNLSPFFDPGLVLPKERQWVVVEPDGGYKSTSENPLYLLQPPLVLPDQESAIEEYITSNKLELIVTDVLFGRITDRLYQSPLFGSTN